MLAAFPMFHTEISPRFCAADKLLLVEISDGSIKNRETLVFSPELGIPQKLRILSIHKVEHLYCGGFNRRYLQLADSMGITVIWGLSGEVEPIIIGLTQGKEPESFNRPCQWRGGRMRS